jgi:hypothetical protein
VDEITERVLKNDYKNDQWNYRGPVQTPERIPNKTQMKSWTT